MESSLAVPERMGRLEMRADALENAKENIKLLTKFYNEVLKEGTDYGTIPGTQKPSLYQPRAEILALSLAMRGDTKTIGKREDFDKDHPFFFYEAETRI